MEGIQCDSRNSQRARDLCLPSLLGYDISENGKFEICFVCWIKVVLNVVHPKKGHHGLSVSVNTAKFHPSHGVGIIYGTNHGTVRHCRVG